MPEEVIEMLAPKPGMVIADCTLGGSGHSRLILEKILPDGLLIGMDQDVDAIENAQNVFAGYEKNVHLINSNFINLDQALLKLNVEKLDGIFADLGVSTHQLLESGRGFAFSKDEPLDMRMDHDGDFTAADIVNNYSQKELKKLFWDFGEERWSGRIAERIVTQRQISPIQTSGELAEIAVWAVPKKAAFKMKIHPGTRIFMALRIAVNNELGVLEQFLDKAVDHLKPGGRICILSFHSLEDRIVKQKFRLLAAGCDCPKDFPICVCGKESRLKVLTRKPKRPSQEEVNKNPAARSTILRAGKKL